MKGSGSTPFTAESGAFQAVSAQPPDHENIYPLTNKRVTRIEELGIDYAPLYGIVDDDVLLLNTYTFSVAITR